MELGHFPYKKGTYEGYVGVRGLQQRGKKKWRKHVGDVVERLVAALQPDDVVLGGGNVKQLEQLPPGCRAGHNANAFKGGFPHVGRRAEAGELACAKDDHRAKTRGSVGRGHGNSDRTSRLEGSHGALAADSKPTSAQALRGRIVRRNMKNRVT